MSRRPSTSALRNVAAGGSPLGLNVQAMVEELLELRRIRDLAEQYVKLENADPDDVAQFEANVDATEAAYSALEKALGL